jgi:hypothetical protein
VGAGSVAATSKREVVGILKKLQIGAGERRAVHAGHGFKTTATIDVVVSDSERNEAENERRQLERAAAGQPSTKRRPAPAVAGDVARRQAGRATTQACADARQGAQCGGFVVSRQKSAYKSNTAKTPQFFLIGHLFQCLLRS